MDTMSGNWKAAEALKMIRTSRDKTFYFSLNPPHSIHGYHVKLVKKHLIIAIKEMTENEYVELWEMRGGKVVVR